MSALNYANFLKCVKCGVRGSYENWQGLCAVLNIFSPNFMLLHLLEKFRNWVTTFHVTSYQITLFLQYDFQNHTVNLSYSDCLKQISSSKINSNVLITFLSTCKWVPLENVADTVVGSVYVPFQIFAHHSTFRCLGNGLSGGTPSHSSSRRITHYLLLKLYVRGGLRSQRSIAVISSRDAGKTNKSNTHRGDIKVRSGFS